MKNLSPGSRPPFPLTFMEKQLVDQMTILARRVEALANQEAIRTRELQSIKDSSVQTKAAGHGIVGGEQLELPFPSLPSPDPFVDKVVEEYLRRSRYGINKYGTTTARKDIDLLGWLQHLQEELMDATIYIERIKHELK